MEGWDAEKMTCTLVETCSVSGSELPIMSGEDYGRGMNILTATISEDEGAGKLASTYTPTATATKTDNGAGPS